MKRTSVGFSVLGWLALFFVLSTTVQAQRPYIGFVYPAGAQQGTAPQIRLGGQQLDDIEDVIISGRGVTARLVDYHRRLNNQEIQLLNEQLRLLKKTAKSAESSMAMMDDNSMMMSSGEKAAGKPAAGRVSTSKDSSVSAKELAVKIDERVKAWVQQPASAAVASLAFVEVVVSPDAEPGNREIRLVTARGVSNPLVFNIGQVPEVSRKPMNTCRQQTLGKEATALRNRPSDEAEVRITIPCTVNGQIAPREVNSYRFDAKKGQKLVVSTQARQLIPYIADAVPGWFQPVVAIFDAKGREVAFNDDYRFKPDPVLFFTVPEDGEYVCTMRDSIYRGREDFVYRMTIGELPFITQVFPLGGQSGTPFVMEVDGINLSEERKVSAGGKGSRAGVYSFMLPSKGMYSNSVPFVIDWLPDSLEQEPNDSIATAQKIGMLQIINGRINKPDDRDVFQFNGKADQVVALDVMARRLDSPLDSLVKVTDATGRVLAYNDDLEDLASGVNTHHADSSLVVKLPSDGTYYIHLSDTARKGGPEYGYRLRVSDPRPDFQLRIVPSSLSMRVNATGTVTVHVARRDGFVGPINLYLKNSPAGFSAQPVTIPANQTVARFNIKAPNMIPDKAANLIIAGKARIGQLEVERDAVAAEDRMQAFLWRHLVPASEFLVTVLDPAKQPTRRAARLRDMPRPKTTPAPAPAAAPASTAPASTPTTATPTTPTAGVSTAPAAAAAPEAPPKPKFTKQQIAGRLRQLKLLYDEGLLTDSFYEEKVAECEEGSK